MDQLSDMDRERLRALPRDELEELTWQLVEVARSLADKVKQNSTNSSRPPSSDDPYRRRDERQQARNDKANDQGDAGGDAAGSPPAATTNVRNSQQEAAEAVRQTAGNARLLAASADGREPHCRSRCSRLRGVQCRARRRAAQPAGQRALRLRSRTRAHGVADQRCQTSLFRQPLHVRP